MNFSDFINSFCALIFALGLLLGVYKTYKFVRYEVIMQSQRGLSSLETFSRQLTRPK